MAQNNNIVVDIYQLPQTVFSLKELSLIFPQVSYDQLKNRIHYYIKAGYLVHLRKGFYAKKKYNRSELANKLYTPSYVSLETVLYESGIIFQKPSSIRLISYLTRRISIDGISVSYQKAGSRLLTDQRGISVKDFVFTASKERAFLDTVYCYKSYHFDNLRLIDWKSVETLKSIYKSARLEKKVAEYYQTYIYEHA